ncbi:hypothetical protein [Mycolicibacterium conceptionense]|uniref:hypothetical protein n=1 Tax=Mycolicibacterium conceptionense TaxID=451644 RepID=UPI0013F4C3F0|nr:hypothetical protein [Mycolicibacterium conceptionense]
MSNPTDYEEGTMVEQDEPLDVEIVELAEQASNAGSTVDAHEYIGRHRASENGAA